MHGLVLNLTQDILWKHPASPDVIASFGGQDATSDVEDKDTAREWANEYTKRVWEQPAELSVEE